MKKFTYSTYAITPTLHMSVANVIALKFTTSGATEVKICLFFYHSHKIQFLPNSGVPKSTCNFVDGSYSRANPKSMIFMRLPDSVKHKIFSGCERKNQF